MLRLCYVLFSKQIYFDAHHNIVCDFIVDLIMIGHLLHAPKINFISVVMGEHFDLSSIFDMTSLITDFLPRFSPRIS